MKFEICDIVTDTRNPYPHRAPRIGTIVEIDPPAARYRVKWEDKRTWLKESALKLAPTPAGAPQIRQTLDNWLAPGGPLPTPGGLNQLKIAWREIKPTMQESYHPIIEDRLRLVETVIQTVELSIPPDKIVPCRIYQVVSAPDKSRISIGDFIRLDHQRFLEVVSGQTPGREFFLPDEFEDLTENLRLEGLTGEWETFIKNHHFC